MSTEYNIATVAAKLNELSLVTTGPDEMLERLTQAVDIAKAGGITDERLHALLHLAGTRSMTPTTERVLADAGIDTTPWAVLRGERKMVPADALVIERAELPKVGVAWLALAEYCDARPPDPTPVDENDIEALGDLIRQYGDGFPADAARRLIAEQVTPPVAAAVVMALARIVGAGGRS